MWPHILRTSHSPPLPQPRLSCHQQCDLPLSSAPKPPRRLSNAPTPLAPGHDGAFLLPGRLCGAQPQPPVCPASRDGRMRAQRQRFPGGSALRHHSPSMSSPGHASHMRLALRPVTAQAFRPPEELKVVAEECERYGKHWPVRRNERNAPAAGRRRAGALNC